MLSDAHRLLLAAAVRREDGLLPRPAKLAGAALTRMEASLVKAGVAEPQSVEADQPHWRRDEADAPIGLRITAAGLSAAGDSGSKGSQGQVQLPEDHAGNLPDPRGGTIVDERACGAIRSFRSGSKLARLVELLSEPDGVTLEALADALSWQPHTVRAALTRLRQGGASQGPRPAQQARVASGGGFALTTRKEQGCRTVYRIEAPGRPGAVPVDAGDA